MADVDSTLTLLMGDWNFVTAAEDRWCKCTGQWTGATDHREADDWDTHLTCRHGFHELSQPLPTCESGRALSRIDRIYSNHHCSDQLDR
eukprot:2630546-Pyramimonas_sp.AAC.1